jgi:putative hemolysin
MSLIVIELVIILLLVLLNGFFAMSELAIVSSRRPRLQQMAQQGSRGAAQALRLVDDPGNFLSAVQVGITSIGVLAGAFGGATLAGQLDDHLVPLVGTAAPALAIAIVVVVVTYVSLIIGELVPKRIALNNAERIAAVVARPMQVLARLTSPVVWFLRVSTEAVLRLTGVPTQRQVTVTADEVKTLVAEGTEAGIFNEAERDMIDGVMRLADKPVRAIMTPRLEIVWLDPAATAEQIRDRIETSGHSRFPLSGRGIDGIDGVVHSRDILSSLLAGEPLDLQATKRTPISVHESTPILRLIELFRQAPIHMALVVDEYGTIEGIVTANDVLSAIAGVFAEDADADEATRIVRRDDGSWLMDGMVSIEEAERVLERRGLRDEDDAFHTLAGFVLWRLGHVPRIGEHFAWRDLRFEVVDMDGRRIDRVLVTQAGSDPG